VPSRIANGPLALRATDTDITVSIAALLPQSTGPGLDGSS
jgi:hypothetical protein